MWGYGKMTLGNGDVLKGAFWKNQLQKGEYYENGSLNPIKVDLDNLQQTRRMTQRFTDLMQLENIDEEEIQIMMDPEMDDEVRELVNQLRQDMREEIDIAEIEPIDINIEGDEDDEEQEEEENWEDEDNQRSSEDIDPEQMQ